MHNPKNPLKRKVNPIYQNTEKSQEIVQEVQEQEQQLVIDEQPIQQVPIVSIPVTAPKATQETQQLPALPYPTRGLGQPSFHDRRSKVPYEKRYRKENFMLDVRLVPYIYDWLETHGINKTDAVNRAWLKVLLADGYQIDPTILDRPCRPEDLPEGL